MSTGPAPPAPPPIEPLSKHERDEYEALIEHRLNRTQRQVKVVDIVAGLLALITGTLGYLLIAAILDHWLIPGGLGFGGRMLLSFGLLLGAGYYIIAHLLPLVVRRINPIFAAYTIERHRPTLKNSLINLLFLRRDAENLGRDQLSLRIYRGMEENAATELADPSVEAAVDHSAIIRLGYVLAGVLAVAAIYLALSPKSPLVSFRRVILPWAEIDAPTRVTIQQVEPGDTVAFQGDNVTVSAEVRGIQPDEPVSLYFTTADGQSLNEAIPMAVPNGEYRYRCDVPPGSLGLQQDLHYFIAAGDAKTKPFAVKVEVPLTILVDQVHYDYPDYTGITDRTAPAGDLRAIEGTKVRIDATASKPIARAAVELDCDARNAVAMTADGTNATGRFTLRMDPKDPAVPEFSSYQLRFRDADGRHNPRPIRHEIDVIADLPPDIRLVDPPEDKIELPVNGSLEWKIRAADPDFALRRIAIRAERESRSLAIKPLLDRPRPEQPYTGTYEATYRFDPSELKLQPGDEVTYWAEADDNKEPIGNHSETPRRTVVIVEPPPLGEQQPGDDSAGQAHPDNDQGGDAPQGSEPRQQPNERAGEEPMQGKPGEDQKPEEAQQKQQENQDLNSPQEKNQQEGQQGGQEGAGAEQSGNKSQKQQGDQQDGDQQSQEKGQKSDGSQDDRQGESQRQGDAQQGEGQQQTQQDKGQESPAGGQQGKAPEQGRSSRQSDDSAGAESKPVDGETNPGEAIDRILEHRSEQQQNGKKPPQEGSSKADPQQPGEPSQNPQQSDQPTSEKDGQPQGGQSRENSGRQDAGGEEKQANQRQGKDEPMGGQKPAQSDNASDGQKPSQPQQATENQPGGEQASDGQNSQPRQDAQGSGDKPGQDQSQANQDNQQSGEKGGAPQTPKSDSGSGKPSQDQQGPPSPQEGNQPRDKTPDGTKQDETSGQEATSPSTSPKDSDSKGDEAGDRSGGGGKGGGQQSDQPGPGSPGSNTPADQGGKPSTQQGKDETGSKGGDQAKSDKPTGQPGSETGEPGSGSKQQPGGGDPQNAPDPQKPAEQPGGEPGQSQSPEGGQPGGRQSGDQSTSGAGNPTQGGMPGEQQADDRPPESVPLGADDPNLEYANEQTELALEHLKDQLAKEDPEVLDRLGWDRKQAEQFIRNWEKMRRDARQSGERGETGQRELKDALKSLGLRPRGTELQGGRSTADPVDNLRENRRYDPPAEWADWFRAYTKGLGETREPPTGTR